MCVYIYIYIYIGIYTYICQYEIGIYWHRLIYLYKYIIYIYANFSCFFVPTRDFFPLYVKNRYRVLEPITWLLDYTLDTYCMCVCVLSSNYTINPDSVSNWICRNDFLGTSTCFTVVRRHSLLSSPSTYSFLSQLNVANVLSLAQEAR